MGPERIEMLECAGIIERSISPWASPVVIVPKKSTPGEPPRRRMCVDYRRINKLQPQAEGNPNPEPPVQAEGGATATPAAGPDPAITAPP